MTIKELIKELQTYEQELLVTMNHYVYESHEDWLDKNMTMADCLIKSVTLVDGKYYHGKQICTGPHIRIEEIT